jgi:hypothetical protein
MTLKRLCQWLHLPFIDRVERVEESLVVVGNRFGEASQPQKQVLLDNASARVVEWSDTRILVKLATATFPRSVILVNDTGVSNRYLVPPKLSAES